MKEQRGGKNFL